MNPLRIGTRASPLALWQARHVADRLRSTCSRPIELVHIQTAGDRDRTASLAQIGGQGAFTKEIQQALLDGRVDVAVHSLKDLPTEPVAGIDLAAVPVRGPVEDVLVSRSNVLFDDLPRGAGVATGSLRRRAQMLHRRADLVPIDIRGNVDTRLRKLAEGLFDALILARAGLERLNRLGEISEVLSEEWMAPAVGQGALGLECRSDDAETRAALQPFDDPATRAAVTAERALLGHLGGGCQVPLGALGRVEGDRLTLRAVVVAPDGLERIAEQISGFVTDAFRLGTELAERLRALGAEALLR